MEHVFTLPSPSSSRALILFTFNVCTITSCNYNREQQAQKLNLNPKKSTIDLCFFKKKFRTLNSCHAAALPEWWEGTLCFSLFSYDYRFYGTENTNSEMRRLHSIWPLSCHYTWRSQKQFTNHIRDYNRRETNWLFSTMFFRHTRVAYIPRASLGWVTASHSGAHIALIYSSRVCTIREQSWYLFTLDSKLSLKKSQRDGEKNDRVKTCRWKRYMPKQSWKIIKYSIDGIEKLKKFCKQAIHRRQGLASLHPSRHRRSAVVVVVRQVRSRGVDDWLYSHTTAQVRRKYGVWERKGYDENWSERAR